MESGPICAGLSETLSGIWSEGLLSFVYVASIAAMPPKDSEPRLLMDPPFTCYWASSSDPHFCFTIFFSPRAPTLPCPDRTPHIRTPSVFPVELQLGSKLDWLLPHRPSLPLELVYVIGGITRVHFPFSMGDLGVCKEGFGRFLENTAKFRD